MAWWSQQWRKWRARGAAWALNRRMSAAEVRGLALRCLAEHRNWELIHAGYDVKVGLMGCHRVGVLLDERAHPLSVNAFREYTTIVSGLQTLMERRDLLEGEDSSEAASIGAILGRFEDAMRSSLQAPRGHESQVVL